MGNNYKEMKITFAIAALIAVTNAVDLKKIHHPSRESNLKFAEGFTDNEVDVMDFTNAQQQEQMGDALPTCDKFETTNCQPNCTESLTTGCTEARTPNAPARDRYEGRRTFKGPEKSESPWSTL